MDPSKPTPLKRREFFLAAGRYLLLTGAATFVALQETKRLRLSNDPDCIRVFTCDECVEFRNCRLPKAEGFRSEHPEA